MTGNELCALYMTIQHLVMGLLSKVIKCKYTPRIGSAKYHIGYFQFQCLPVKARSTYFMFRMKSHVRLHCATCYRVRRIWLFTVHLSSSGSPLARPPLSTDIDSATLATLSICVEFHLATVTLRLFSLVEDFDSSNAPLFALEWVKETTAV